MMRQLPTPEADLVLALSDGVHEQPLWGRFLNLLKAQTGTSYCGLFFRPVDNASEVQLYAGRMLPDAYLRLYRHRYGVDPLPHHKMRPGRIYTLDELMDPHDPRQRGFYEEILVPGGMRHLRSVRVTEASGVDAWLTLIDAQEIRAATTALLGRLVPHFQAAVRNFIAIERERVRASISAAAMGRLNFGWLMVDQQCRILDATANIDHMLGETALLRRDRHGHLLFTAGPVHRQVTELVRRFAADQEVRPQAFNLGEDPWTDILVSPVPAPLQSPGSAAAAIIYLSGDRWSQSDRCEQLVDLFGLLPSEARLAWRIAQGRSIADAAADLGLTVETARNYSKKIYAKTGAAGQVELVRIVMNSVLAIA